MRENQWAQRNGRDMDYGELLFKDKLRPFYRALYLLAYISLLLFICSMSCLLTYMVASDLLGEISVPDDLIPFLLLFEAAIIIPFAIWNVRRKSFKGDDFPIREAASPFITRVFTRGVKSPFFIPFEKVSGISVDDYLECMTFYFLKVSFEMDDGTKYPVWVSDNYRFFTTLQQALGEDRFGELFDKAPIVEGLRDGTLDRQGLDDNERLLIYYLVHNKESYLVFFREKE